MADAVEADPGDGDVTDVDARGNRLAATVVTIAPRSPLEWNRAPEKQTHRLLAQ